MYGAIASPTRVLAKAIPLSPAALRQEIASDAVAGGWQLSDRSCVSAATDASSPREGCVGPPLCRCGCVERLADRPTSDRPCCHNDWDDVRTRRQAKILRCRVCQGKWRLPSAAIPRCAPFARGDCAKGGQCGLLHVHKKKLAVTERLERFGSLALDRQALADLRSSHSTGLAGSPALSLSTPVPSPTPSPVGVLVSDAFCFALPVRSPAAVTLSTQQHFATPPPASPACSDDTCPALLP